MNADYAKVQHTRSSEHQKSYQEMSTGQVGMRKTPLQSLHGNGWATPIAELLTDVATG